MYIAIHGQMDVSYTRRPRVGCRRGDDGLWAGLYSCRRRARNKFASWRPHIVVSLVAPQRNRVQAVPEVYGYTGVNNVIN